MGYNGLTYVTSLFVWFVVREILGKCWCGVYCALEIATLVLLLRCNGRRHVGYNTACLSLYAFSLAVGLCPLERVICCLTAMSLFPREQKIKQTTQPNAALIKKKAPLWY
jgi:hypothetical protein